MGPPGHPEGRVSPSRWTEEGPNHRTSPSMCFRPRSTVSTPVAAAGRGDRRGELRAASPDISLPGIGRSSSKGDSLAKRAQDAGERPEGCLRSPSLNMLTMLSNKRVPDLRDRTPHCSCLPRVSPLRAWKRRKKSAFDCRLPRKMLQNPLAASPAAAHLLPPARLPQEPGSSCLGTPQQPADS